MRFPHFFCCDSWKNGQSRAKTHWKNGQQILCMVVIACESFSTFTTSAARLAVFSSMKGCYRIHPILRLIISRMNSSRMRPVSTKRAAKSPLCVRRMRTFSFSSRSISCACGNQRRVLKPDSDPKVCFTICDGEKVKAAYAYCNLHGLWKAELPCAK